MAVKSIIDIQVNDGAFKQFDALFQRYQKALQSTPLQWRNVAIAQQQGLKGFRDLVLEQAAAIGQQKLLNEAHKAAINLLRQEESSWERIKRQTTGAATNIRDMTGQLMKWGSLTAVFSGLLGAGGLFGISRLSQNVSIGRRGALGLGASYGGQKAFGTAFDRFVDPGSVLSGVSGALGDVTKKKALYGAGLSEKDLKGDTATVAARSLNSVKKLLDQTPDSLIGNIADSRHLGDLGYSLEDLRRIKHSSAGELARQQRQFRKLSGDYAVGSSDQRAYQDFTTALTDAGNQIETTFVRGIVPLVPGFEKLSGSVVKTVDVLLKSVSSDTMEKLGKGIEHFADFIGSHEFQNNLKTFASGVGIIAGKIGGFVSWMGGGPGNAAYEESKTNAQKLRDDRASGRATWYGQLGSILSGKVPMKEGAGTLTPELAAIARGIQSSYPGFDRVTAGEDNFHKGRNSAHNDGRAFDFTIKNPADSAHVADLVRGELDKRGIKGRVIDEYKNPSRGATGGHIHVQTDVKVMNAAGSNVIVSAQQVTPSP
ncbi:hypothetical protein [Nitrobacter sp. JJSN]|uniref:hypothetical protein n=1 Tax=Nitrobacter sp. JJSN TaxID=3453033 RepID=UPI003F76057F